MGFRKVVLLNQTLMEHRDTHFNAQRSENQLVSVLRKQILWLSFGAEVNPIRRWNPLRPLFHWYYSRRINRYIPRELESRFADHQKVGEVEGVKRRKSKTVIDLALDRYLEEQSRPGLIDSMDATFKKFAISQMKVFILAGHDTTSSTLCYIFYLLPTSPPALERVRAEHDEVFGSDLSRVQSIIIDNPYILNKLTYTLAVIKETIRLFPAGSSTRQGDPGFSLTDDGHQYPTEGCIV
jgi:sterigmatocystin biosynthesis cytochrome P450 monooxygenase